MVDSNYFNLILIGINFFRSNNKFDNEFIFTCTIINRVLRIDKQVIKV